MLTVLAEAESSDVVTLGERLVSILDRDGYDVQVRRNPDEDLFAAPGLLLVDAALLLPVSPRLRQRIRSSGPSCRGATRS